MFCSSAIIIAEEIKLYFQEVHRSNLRLTKIPSYLNIFCLCDQL